MQVPLVCRVFRKADAVEPNYGIPLQLVDSFETTYETFEQDVIKYTVVAEDSIYGINPKISFGLLRGELPLLHGEIIQGKVCWSPV